MATETTLAFAQELATLIPNWYVGLIREDGSEVPVPRQSFGVVNITEDDTAWIIRTSELIAFPVASSDLAPATNKVAYVGIYKTQTGSDLLLKIALPKQRTYLTGEQLVFTANTLHIRILKSV